MGSKLARGLSVTIDNIIKVLLLIGCIMLGIMVLVVVVNVVGRLFFQHPLKGTVELVEVIMVFVAFFAIAFMAKQRGHVAVELVVRHFPRHVQAIIYSVGFFLSAAISAVITYQSIVNTIYYAQHLDQTTAILLIPLAPFNLVMALGCLILCMVLLECMIRPLPAEELQKGGASK